LNKTISYIVHLNVDADPNYISEEMLSEIENLVINLEIIIKQKEIIKIKKINSSTLIGEGNLIKINQNIKEKNINLLVVNNNLTPAQQKNLENRLKVKVTDRTGIILEVFARRAKSNEGKMQVQLAELIYRKSRLVRAWTHLERQRGGTTFIGGPGELQIELDRRLIQEKILNIKKRLSKVKQRRHVQRNLRKNNNFKTVALIGYTNAGKTLLFNKLTKKRQSSRSRLFETLDTKISRVYLGENIYIGLIDTVGFINNIPTSLIESFKATLEEVNKADILLNIVDVNDINANQKIIVTKKILMDTGVEKNKISEMITIYNKIDLKGFEGSYQHKKNYISALTGKGVSDLKKTLKNSLI
tara:strand:- start:2588 stop:3661 length:1074 start_codon:yes stop_codon:yes gene_type:complete